LWTFSVTEKYLLQEILYNLHVHSFSFTVFLFLPKIVTTSSASIVWTFINYSDAKNFIKSETLTLLCLVVLKVIFASNWQKYALNSDIVCVLGRLYQKQYLLYSKTGVHVWQNYCSCWPKRVTYVMNKWILEHIGVVLIR
jgi:hypothetical protein